MVLTGFFVLSPVIGFLATVAGRSLRQLDISVEISGPHDFAVRFNALRLGRTETSTASRTPRDVTIAIRPSSMGRDARASKGDLPDGESKIFLAEGLDRGGDQIARRANQWSWPSSSRSTAHDARFEVVASDDA
jgi:hypothetical protein